MLNNLSEKELKNFIDSLIKKSKVGKAANLDDVSSQSINSDEKGGLYCCIDLDRKNKKAALSAN